MSINKTLAEVKAAGEDFEWYPTTDGILAALCKDMPKYISKRGSYSTDPLSSFLDIGSGNGKVLSTIAKIREGVKLYAIEKSGVLRAAMSESIYVIGTDFYEQSLIDKGIDVTFCNPPYSDFETWATKIIRESSSKHVYLVIPTRWNESQSIKEAIKYRDAKYRSLGEFSFHNAERQARAVVNLVRIDLSSDTEDAFNREFSGIFPYLTEKMPGSAADDNDDEPKAKASESKFTHLVTGKNFIKSLVGMYREDIARIKKNYEAVGMLDRDVLRELGTNAEKIRELLRVRLKGLKTLYWKELISRMDEITSRLIGKRREKLLNTLNENGSVDFTEGNAYAVILWILKHANGVIDEQLIEVYEQMIEKANIVNYKSNSRVYAKDRWRYNDEKPTHIYLEYRIVLEYCGRIEVSFSSRNLSERGCDFIRDILTVANNLEFTCKASDERLYHWDSGKFWKAGETQVFHCVYKGKEEVLFEIRAHLNGNMHIRMNQKFALALNVEYGRLKGWLHSKEQAAEEVKDVKATEYFKTNTRLLPGGCMLLSDFSENKVAPETVFSKPEKEPSFLESEKVIHAEQVDLFSIAN